MKSVEIGFQDLKNKNSQSGFLKYVERSKSDWKLDSYFFIFREGDRLAVEEGLIQNFMRKDQDHSRFEICRNRFSRFEKQEFTIWIFEICRKVKI